MEYVIKSNNPYESEVARMIEKVRKQQVQLMKVPVIDRTKWEPCVCCKPSCSTCINMGQWDKYGKPIVCLKCENNSNYDPDDNYCSECGRPLTGMAWKELERRVFGE